jgi:hypothetical protein
MTTAMRGSDLGRLCDARGWSRSQLLRELRSAAAQRSEVLPGDDSLRRMTRQWVNGDRGLSPFYVGLLATVFGTPFAGGRAGDAEGDAEPDVDLAALIARSTSVDATLIDLLEAQTDQLRALDRRLGAAHGLSQTTAHLDQMSDLLRYSLPGRHRYRDRLAGAVADAAALAGWQALDLGQPHKAWLLHDVGKAAGRECDDVAALAHVTAEQAYALLDLDRGQEAQEVVRQARKIAGTRVPEVLQAWLCAAEAETHAATGDDRRARRALDQADKLLPADTGEQQLPYIFLNQAHLSRWRGNCLARLGATEAVDDLHAALDHHDPNFVRAAAGMRCDLAMAHAQRGEHREAREQATAARQMAEQTSSARQQRRINQILFRLGPAGR